MLPRPLIVTLVFGAALVLAIALAGFLGGYRLNLTPSYPLGLWRIVQLERQVLVGDRLFICPPDTDDFQLAVERGYLPRGLCPGGMAPLIKTVAALASQEVEIGAAVAIDGVPLAGSTLQHADPQGRQLGAAPGGPVPPGHVFLHSRFGGSYDSRYFGTIPMDGILGLAQPILTWSP